MGYIVIILVISILVGAFSSSIMYGLQLLFSKKEKIEENRVSKTLIKLNELENELKKSIVDHKKQLLHIEKQKSRLLQKEERSELIKRYQADCTVLINRVELQKKTLTTVWKSRALLQYKNHFREAVECHPPIQIPDSLEDENDAFYQKGVMVLRDYLKKVHALRNELNESYPEPPSSLSVPEEVLLEIEQERLQTIENFDLLTKRIDGFIDQLLYVQDWRSTKNLGRKLTIDEDELEDSLSQVSSSLEELHSLAKVENILEDDTLHDDLALQLQKLQLATEDMDARIHAEEEVEKMLRKYAQRQSQRSKKQ